MFVVVAVKPKPVIRPFGLKPNVPKGVKLSGTLVDALLRTFLSYNCLTAVLLAVFFYFLTVFWSSALTSAVTSLLRVSLM